MDHVGVVDLIWRMRNWVREGSPGRVPGGRESSVDGGVEGEDSQNDRKDEVDGNTENDKRLMKIPEPEQRLSDSRGLLSLIQEGIDYSSPTWSVLSAPILCTVLGGGWRSRTRSVTIT